MLAQSRGETVTFRDLDGTGHIIKIDEGHQFTIPANGSIQVKLDLINGTGAHGISCDDGKRGLSGVVFLEPAGLEASSTPTPTFKE